MSKETWTERRIGEATAGEAIAQAVAPGPAPAKGVDFSALNGRQLYAAVLSADVDVRHAAQAELQRRLRARGDLDAKGELRADKCFSCREVLGSAQALARHHHQLRPPDAVDHLRDAGVRDAAGLEAVIAGSLRETPALAAVRRYLDGSASVFVMIGAAGVGKSWAGIYALGQLGGLWASALEFGNLLPADWLEALCVSAGVVVIDDLGQEHLGQAAYALSVVDQIVTRRCERKLRLLMTTMQGPDALRVRYGERFWSRASMVEVGGEDLRRA